MGRLFSGMGWLTVIGAGAALAFAQYRANETGRDVVTVLKNLPEELQVSAMEWQARLMQAVAEGKKAADAKEVELEQDLAGQGYNRQESPSPAEPMEAPDPMV